MLERFLQLTVCGLRGSGVISLRCLASDSIVMKAPLFLVGQDDSEFFVRLHPPVFRFIGVGESMEAAAVWSEELLSSQFHGATAGIE